MKRLFPLKFPTMKFLLTFALASVLYVVVYSDERTSPSIEHEKWIQQKRSQFDDIIKKSVSHRSLNDGDISYIRKVVFGLKFSKEEYAEVTKIYTEIGTTNPMSEDEYMFSTAMDLTKKITKNEYQTLIINLTEAELLPHGFKLDFDKLYTAKSKENISITTECGVQP